MSQRPDDPSGASPPPAPPRPMRTAIVGGGRGCEHILRMVQEDTLGRFQMEICGVADIDPEAPGVQRARETGVPVVTTDYRELYDIPDLDLIIELVGSYQVRDEIERTRPRHVRLIDHFGARLFWDLHQAEEGIIRHRTEMRDLVERERRRIAQIYDCIPDEILVVDKDMVVEHANASFLRNNDVELADIVGHHCYETEQEVRGECQVAVENCPFFQVVREGEPASTVRKHFDADGNVRYAAIVAAPLLDSAGNVSGMLEMTRDITNRIMLEDQLRATEVQLRQFMELAPLATFVKNRAGQYIEVNPAACALLGRPKQEIIGKTDLEILPREAAERMRRGDDTVRRERREFSDDTELEIGGERVFLSTIKYPVIDASGEVTAVCGLAMDVTAQRQAEAELGGTRAYLQDILDHSPVIIITTDADGRIVSFNRGAELSLGYDADEVIGTPAAHLYVDPADRDPMVRRVTKGETIHDYETTLKRKDGTGVPVSITMAQLKDPQGRMTGTVGMARDISHRRALMNQVVQSERLAAVGRLAAGVAHEINNPLAVIGEICGYMQDLMAMDPRDVEALVDELDEGLPKIAAQVRRCRNITSRLLSFARKSAARVEVSDVAAVLDEVLPFLEKESQLARVTIHRDYAPDLPRVRIEEVQLGEIFINLITNAIHALTSQGGGNIWLESRRKSDRVMITVRDDGPGIPEEVRDKLFDPFVSTKPQGQGTGLGLSICYGIVKRYDGEIRVRSEVGQGAEFTVVLRVHQQVTGERPA